MDQAPPSYAYREAFTGVYGDSGVAPRAGGPDTGQRPVIRGLAIGMVLGAALWLGIFWLGSEVWSHL